jgi:hypothetical protein
MLSVCLLLFLAAWPAAAQVIDPLQQDHEKTVQFLPRYNFYLGAEHISSADPRFVWDTNFGGELDLVDYVFGRATFVANYQAVLGEEARTFDPNQGSYTLSGLISGRRHGVEAALEFYHQCRHLTDRSKPVPVDWSMVGGRLSRSMTLDSITLDTRVDARKVVRRTIVDYRWEIEAEVRARRPLNHSTSILGEFTARMLGVDGTQNRGTQHGYRAEGGVLLQGKAGGIELFVAGEQRIDPYPLEFGTGKWVSVGFRFLSR